MREILKIVEELVRTRFWGELTLKFQNGKVVVIGKNEQIKISE